MRTSWKVLASAVAVGLVIALGVSLGKLSASPAGSRQQRAPLPAAAVPEEATPPQLFASGPLTVLNPFLVDRTDKRLVLDFSRDAAAAERALASIGDALDGYTIAIEGMSVAGSDARRARDKSDASNLAVPAMPLRDCAARFFSITVVATPFAGCEPVAPSTDPLRLGRITEAVEYSLSGLVGQLFTGVRITNDTTTPGGVIVTAPNDLLTATVGAMPPSLDIGELLYLNAFSDRSVTAVRLGSGSDCLRMAYATGGDSCPGVVTRSEFAEVWK